MRWGRCRGCCGRVVAGATRRPLSEKVDSHCCWLWLQTRVWGRDDRRGEATLRKSRDFLQSRLSRSCLSLLLLLLLETVQWTQHDARPRHSASSHPAPPRSHQTLLDFGLFFLDDDSSVQPAVALPKHAVQASPPLAPSTGFRRRSRKHSPRQSALLASPLGITHSFRFHPADPHQLALGGDRM